MQKLLHLKLNLCNNSTGCIGILFLIVSKAPEYILELLFHQRFDLSPYTRKAWSWVLYKSQIYKRYDPFPLDIYNFAEEMNKTKAVWMVLINYEGRMEEGTSGWLFKSQNR